MNEKEVNEIIELIDNSSCIEYLDDLIKIQAEIKEATATRRNVDVDLFFLYHYILLESIKIVSAIKDDESLQLVRKILKEYFGSIKEWDDIGNLYFMWKELEKCENCTMECRRKKSDLIITKG